MPDFTIHPASYRDPSGFVFRYGDSWYRQVNIRYREDYLQLTGSGLSDELTANGLLLPHNEVPANLTGSADWFRTLLPEQLSFISLPEEWCPAQLRDAALSTLAINRIAMEKGMILKDATPRNIQFPKGRPVLIDSLSFERYDPARPWVAYRQFCECFLYPLLLHHYLGSGTHRIISAWPDGIPAGITARMLPFRSRLKPGVWLHAFLPAMVSRSTRKSFKSDTVPPSFSKTRLIRLLSNLEDTVWTLNSPSPRDPGWLGYYEKDILSQRYLQEKRSVFDAMTDPIDFDSALDLGANDGYFTRILAEKDLPVIAAEADWRCVQALFQSRVKGRPVQALCVDIGNPTPASGFDHRERSAFSDRAVSDLVVALALLHHLVLGRNIPLPMVAAYLARLTRRWLLIEFVPLSDEKAAQLVQHKSAYPIPYDQAAFERQFSAWFTIDRKVTVPGTERIIYRMRKIPL
jgi:hypothetical protein